MCLLPLLWVMSVCTKLWRSMAAAVLKRRLVTAMFWKKWLKAAISWAASSQAGCGALWGNAWQEYDWRRDWWNIPRGYADYRRDEFGGLSGGGICGLFPRRLPGYDQPWRNAERQPLFSGVPRKCGQGTGSMRGGAERVSVEIYLLKMGEVHGIFFCGLFYFLWSPCFMVK